MREIAEQPKWLKLVRGLILVGPGERSKLYRVTTEKVSRKMVQARVLTNCPLCGFKQRLERLTGGEYHVTDPGDLLPLEVGAIYAEKRAHGLVYESKELRLKPGQRQAMLEALAAKMLPLVQYLSVQVPEFGKALATPELTVTVERDVVVSGLELPVVKEKGVEQWRSVSVSRVVRRSKAVTVEMSVPQEMDIPVEMNVPMDGT